VKTLNLEIAGIGLSFSLSDALYPLLKTRYAAFSPSQSPRRKIVVAISKKSSSHQDATPNLVCKNEWATISRGDFFCRFNLKKGRGSLKVKANVYSFDSFLRVFYSFLLVRRKGFLIHAAGIVAKDKGFLFPGVSGTGKSTISRLSKQKKVLTDELCAVVQKNGRYFLCGTPFWGELKGLGVNLRKPLEKILFPVKAKRIATSPISDWAACLEILKCILFFEKSATMSDRILREVGKMVQAVQSEKLFFTRGGRFWETLFP